MFDANCKSGLYSLYLHSLDHLIENADRFGTLKKLVSSPFEGYNMPSKSSYISASKQHSFSMEYIASEMERQSTPENDHGKANVAKKLLSHRHEG